MKTRTYTAAALLALFIGLFGCFEDSAFDNIGGGLTTAGLPIGNLLVAPTYTVTYDGNGSTGGDAPVDATAYGEGDLVTVLGNPDGLFLSGNSFIGWNTDPLATTALYTQGSVFVMGSSNITLYAIWSALPTFTVTYNGNGNTGGTAPVDTTNYLVGQTVTVLNSGTLTNTADTGYVFAGWNTASNGSGTTYDPGDTFTMGGTDVNLWAVWSDQWVQDAYLKASNADVSDYFGSSVAIDDDTIVVGAVQEDSNYMRVNNTNASASTDNSIADSGAAYIYKRNSLGNWYQDAYLKASNNGEPSVIFGNAVAVDGDRVVVGARLEDSKQTYITNDDGYPRIANDSALDAGAVYVFEDVKGWIQDAYLKAPNAEANDYFGASVAVSGSTVVVGAPGEDSSQTIITNGETASADDSEPASGAVYVFKDVRQGRFPYYSYEWQQDAYLKASNAEESDYFGTSVAVDGDTIVVGAPGEESSQTTITNTNGSASSNNTASSYGAVYVFKENTSGDWYQDAYLKASNAEASDYFGISVSVDGDTIVVGAHGEDSSLTIDNSDASPTFAASNNARLSSGAAYVFKRNSSTGIWSQDAYLKASNSEAYDEFGKSVAIRGNVIVVGAHQEDSDHTEIININGSASANNDALSSGAAYVFKKDSLLEEWVQDAYLKASNAAANNNFGSSVAVSENTIVVGAYREDNNQATVTNDDNSPSTNSGALNSGAAYVFTLK